MEISLEKLENIKLSGMIYLRRIVSYLEIIIFSAGKVDDI